MKLATNHTHRGEGCEAFVIEATEDGPASIPGRRFLIHDFAKARFTALEAASQGLAVRVSRIIGTAVTHGEDGAVNDLNQAAADTRALALHLQEAV